MQLILTNVAFVEVKLRQFSTPLFIVIYLKYICTNIFTQADMTINRRDICKDKCKQQNTIPSVYSLEIYESVYFFIDEYIFNGNVFCKT